MTKKNARNTRRRIVNAAWKLFYKQGYENTTVKEIIELFQTSKGSFYHYFNGKNALLSILSLLFDEKYKGFMDTLTPKMSAMDKLLFLSSGLFGMVKNSISLDPLARLLPTQLATTGRKHLLNHNRTCYKLLRGIIAQGQESGELNAETSVSGMVKPYVLSERALLCDWCLCAGEYSLCRYNASVMPAFLSHSLSRWG